MFGSQTEIKTTHKFSGMVGKKSVIESSHRVRVEVVADQNHFFRFRVTTLRSVSRSSFVRRTIYFFSMATLLGCPCFPKSCPFAEL